MADNTTLNTGTGGDVIATDDIGGVKHQLVKVEWGAADAATQVTTGASALPIQDGGNSITVDGSITANAGTNLNTSLLALEAGGNLASIKAKTDNIPALGQAAMAASTPVAIASNQSAVPVSGTVTANLAAGTNNIGDVDILTTVDVAASTGSGSLTAAEQAVTLTLVGQAATTFQLTGTWVGTITFEASNDNSTWTSIFAMKAGDNVIAQTATANDIYRCTTAGFGYVRARCSAYTSGTIVVTARAAVNTSGVFLNFPLPEGSNTIGAITGTGTFAAQIDGAALTSLQLNDDPVFQDNAGFTDNSSKVKVAGYYFDETAGTALTENDVAAARIDSKRAQVHVIEDSATRGLRAGVVDETGASAVDAFAVGGGTPHDSVDSGNPVKVGMKAASALPTAVASADRANAISDLWGRQLVAHIDPAMQVWKNVNVTSTQTGTDVWSPTTGKKIAVTYLQVSAYATTAARVILWFGDNADTTYTAGTDQVLWAGSFAPSSTAKPMMVIAFPNPIFCTTADRELHLTTDAGISLDITVYGYEW